MQLAARPPLTRIRKIDDEIRRGNWPNSRTLALSLEVTARTIRRDIAYLRDQLGAPIEFDLRHNGYFYTEQSYQLPFLQLTEGELIALCLADRMLQACQGTAYAADLARAFEKITSGLNDTITVDLSHLTDLYSFRVTPQAPVEPSIAKRLSDAARKFRRVELDYWTASRDERTHRVVDPYHVTFTDGQWYLIAYCHLRGKIRVFLLARVQQLTVTDTCFDPPTEFRIKNYLRESFSIFRGEEGEHHRVRLRFFGNAARYVGERTWHASQVSEETSDGDLIITLSVSHLREVERWALSWIPECEVLEPLELRERFVASLSQAAACHSGVITEVKSPVIQGAQAKRPLQES
jgi:predicted DNA-binding transcriptional regulator YafY